MKLVKWARLNVSGGPGFWSFMVASYGLMVVLYTGKAISGDAMDALDLAFLIISWPVLLGSGFIAAVKVRDWFKERRGA